MAGTSRALTLKLLADIDNFTKNINKADTEVATFGDKISKFGKIAGAAFLAAGAAAAAYAGKLAIDGVKSAIADEQAQAKLATTLKNVTGATDAQVAATEDYIQKQQFAYGLTDDQLRPSIERLTRATKDVTKAQDLQSIAIDVAAGSGKSLEAVTNAMARAAEGNTTALGKLGVGLTKTQLAAMSADEIFAHMATTFKDQASIQADTFQGKMDRLNQVITEGKETVGVFILQAITPFIETIVNKVVPAIQDFTSNIGDKLQPVINVFKPILEGLTKAFNYIRDSLKENNDELQPFYNLIRNIAAFIVKYLGPALGETLGAAFKVVGVIISTVIDQFASFVSKIQTIYDTIKSIINFIKGAGSKFADMLGFGGTGPQAVAPKTSAVPKASSFSASSLYSPAASTTNITVNGAIDAEGTARTIANVLNQSYYRGTLGAGAFAT
jgi:hypothetical protein